MDVRGAFCVAFGLTDASGVRTALSLVRPESCFACLSWFHGNTASEKSSFHGAATVRCAVTGLEAPFGSVCSAKRDDIDSNGAETRFAVDGLLGVGKNGGIVGDSGSRL